MTSLIYNIGISLIEIGIKLKSTVDHSLKKWLHNRQLSYVLTDIGDINKKSKRIWIHCASLGEYHMARPVLTQLRAHHKSKVEIFLSFYSPSGYNNVNEPNLYDKKFFLPKDSKRIANILIQKIDPDIFIGVKYEFWWNLLNALQDSRIPIVYMNVSFFRKPGFLNPLHPKYKLIFNRFHRIFVQNHTTHNLLSKEGITNTEVIGDTRIDNVINRKLNKTHVEFKVDKPVFIWGSVYDYEIPMINKVVNSTPHLLHIIVPHNVDAKNITKISNLITFEFISELNNKFNMNILVNRVGLLFDLYRLATYTYVGGGFKGKLHNILEPIAHNIPIFIGPNHSNFNEAKEAIEQNMATVINDASDIVEYINSTNQERTTNIYIERQTGASQKISTYITKILYR